jgi:outer membrane protein TolC
MEPQPRTPCGHALVTGLLLIVIAAGCASPVPRPVPGSNELAAARRELAPSKSSDSGDLRPVSFSGSITQPTEASVPPPFAGATELTAEQVVAEVLARNPTVAEMVAAWQAVSAQYPQLISLDDPRITAQFAPASIGRPHMDFGYNLEVSQAFPAPGKRQLRGQSALHEAAAAGADVSDVRLQLAEAARAAFADYFLTGRAIAVNEENLRLLRDFRQNALARFRTGQTSQQDVLQAEVAIARQGERALILERQQAVARARLNTLMHLPPDHPLPPPPATFHPPATLPPAAELRDRAVRQRPDVAALEQRIAADQAAVALARREYAPDFEAMAGYNQMWAESEMRPMIGVRMNLPTRLGRRDAAVAEAEARLARRRAERDRLIDQIQFQVQEAYEQAAESERVLRLFEESTLPAAQANVKLAQAEYTVGRIPFLSLIEAQRELIGLRDRYYEVQAEVIRRRAALERAAGLSPDRTPAPPPGSGLAAPTPGKLDPIPSNR